MTGHPVDPLAVLRGARDFIPDWNDGPSPLRDEYDTALAAVERLVEAARRNRPSHIVDCAFIQTWDGPTPMECDCGVEGLAHALAPFKEDES